MPDSVSTGVEKLPEFSEGDDTGTEFFTLQGIPVTHPAPGNIYIVLKDGKAAKKLKN